MLHLLSTLPAMKLLQRQTWTKKQELACPAQHLNIASGVPIDLLVGSKPGKLECYHQQTRLQLHVAFVRLALQPIDEHT
jgi:hypothetical protein